MEISTSNHARPLCRIETGFCAASWFLLTSAATVAGVSYSLEVFPPEHKRLTDPKTGVELLFQKRQAQRSLPPAATARVRGSRAMEPHESQSAQFRRRSRSKRRRCRPGARFGRTGRLRRARTATMGRG